MKGRLWYALSLLLQHVIIGRSRDHSLLIHYLRLGYVLLRLVNGLIDIHLLAPFFDLVFEVGSGNLLTEYGLRLGRAHSVLLQRL